MFDLFYILYKDFIFYFCDDVMIYITLHWDNSVNITKKFSDFYYD